MTAGRGIAHSERFEDPAALAGGALEMLQTWVALPEADEESAPAFDNYQPDRLPIFTEGGLWMRLIAGEAYGLKNSVRTHSPLFYVHAILQPGASMRPAARHTRNAQPMSPRARLGRGARLLRPARCWYSRATPIRRSLRERPRQ